MQTPKPSRRALLASFLTAPAALAACRRGGAAPRFEGSLVGGNAALGHLLRDGASLPHASTPTPPERTTVLVVGAGPAGLSAAWRLEREGLRDYLVLELEDVPGGTSRSGRNEVSAFPWGAHYVPAPSRENTALVALLREMGVVEGEDDRGRPVVGEQHLVRDLDERVFYEGAWHEGIYPRDGASADDLAQLARFQAEIDRWVAARDAQGRRAFALPRALGGGPSHPDARALDGLTMADWLAQRGFTSPRLRWLVDYACRDDYALPASRTSAWMGVFYFASRVQEPGTPAEELIAFPEGNGALAAHLARGVGPARLRTGQLVRDVRVVEGGVEATVLDARDPRAPRAYTVRAERCVVALPQYLARRVVAARREGAGAGAEAAQRFTYAPWMVANLTLRERPRPRPEGAPLAWDNVLYDSPSLGYVVATHQSLRDHGPTVLTYYYPLVGEDPVAERRRLLATDWRAWADVALADLAAPHPELPAKVARVDVYRWGHAMVRPVPGFATSGALEAAARPVDGRVFFAHCDLSALPLFEEAQFHGVLAAEELLRARGAAVTPLYPARATRG